MPKRTVLKPAPPTFWESLGSFVGLGPEPEPEPRGEPVGHFNPPMLQAPREVDPMSLQALEQRRASELEAYEVEHPTPIHKFMGALSTAVDIADAPMGAGRALMAPAIKALAGGVPRTALRETVTAINKGFRRNSPIRKAFSKRVSKAGGEGIEYTEPEFVGVAGKRPGETIEVGGKAGPTGYHTDIDIAEEPLLSTPSRYVQVRRGLPEAPGKKPFLKTHEVGHTMWDDLDRPTKGKIIRDTISNRLQLHPNIGANPNLYAGVDKVRLANENLNYWMAEAFGGRKLPPKVRSYFIRELGMRPKPGLSPSTTPQQALDPFTQDPDLGLMFRP